MTHSRKSELWDTAVACLARREYGAEELAVKLSTKGFDATEIEDALSRLQSLGLQDDGRYCEAYVRARYQKGFGPERIRQELRQRGIDLAHIDSALNSSALDWLTAALRQRIKKFGSVWPTDYALQQKQKQFLRYRGFSIEHINHVCQHNEY